MANTKLKKNDNVVVISGADRGKKGKILFVDTSKGRVVIEGINKKKKFVRPSQENPKGQGAHPGSVRVPGEEGEAGEFVLRERSQRSSDGYVKRKA